MSEKGYSKIERMSVSDPGGKMSGERRENFEKISECPALITNVKI